VRCSGVATGFGRSLDQRPTLPCLTNIAPPQPDVCWKGSAHVLRVRARSFSTPMRRSPCGNIERNGSAEPTSSG